jgi:hypothetical protein
MYHQNPFSLHVLRGSSIGQSPSNQDSRHVMVALGSLVLFIAGSRYWRHLWSCLGRLSDLSTPTVCDLEQLQPNSSHDGWSQPSATDEVRRVIHVASPVNVISSSSVDFSFQSLQQQQRVRSRFPRLPSGGRSDCPHELLSAFMDGQDTVRIAHISHSSVDLTLTHSGISSRQLAVHGAAPKRSEETSTDSRQTGERQ